jgi:CHAT domain-containing protein
MNTPEDGILTALEVAGMDLQGTQLVVLSACETGVGKISNGDGVYGLRRAVSMAGAESQVISLWKVDDKATEELMTQFYEHLQAGQGRGEALRQSQQSLRLNPLYMDPFYWAGFIPAGDWRSLNP